MEVSFTYFQIRHDFEKLRTKWKYLLHTSKNGEALPPERKEEVSKTRYAVKDAIAKILEVSFTYFQKWRSVAPRTERRSFKNSLCS